MATFIPIPGCAELIAVFTMGTGTESANVFHMQFPGTGPLTTTDLGNAIGDLSAAIVADLEKHLSHDVGLLKVKARDLTSQFSTEAEAAIAGNGGTLMGAAAPPAVAVDVKWSTGLVGRSFRGRSFLMGPDSTKIDDNGEIDGTVYGELQTDAAAFVAALSPGALSSAQLVVASKFHNKAPRSTGITTPVISALVRTRVHSQRRRNRVLG